MNMENRSKSKRKEYNVPALRGTAKSKWTLSGISAETRTAVKKAAHKEGMTVGNWADQVLNAAAREALKGGSPLLSLPPDLLAVIDDMSRKLDKISSDLQQDPAQFAPFSEDIRELVDDLRERTSDSFEQFRKSAQRAADTVSAQAKSAVTQSKEAGGKTLDRLVDAGDAALDSVRQYRNDSQNNDFDPHDRKATASKSRSADGKPNS